MSAKADLDKHFFDSKQRTFLGTARVSLTQLQFGKASSTCREIDPKNVKRLLGIFKLEGCLRLEPDHSISAIVTRGAFTEALAKAGLTVDALLTTKEPPLLNLSGVSITCLYGRHRIAAAKQFLDSFEDWWVVNFYDDVLEDKTLHSMQDEYSNAMNFCHGDIYRNIVAARRAGDEALEGRWLGRLNPSLRKDLGLFFKKEGYQGLRLALDSLLPFVGLWPSFRLGCLRRIFHLHQPEELARYLETVREVWSSILLNRDDLFACLDYDTVMALQLRNPSRYKADLVYVTAQIENSSILARIKDEGIRLAILERLTIIQICIPSIETFHEDTKWLEPCSAAVREHILPKSSSSLFRSLSRKFDHKQSMSTIDESHVNTDERSQFTLAYRRLFAFAWRYFPELTGISPKQNQGGPKQLSKSHNDLVQHEFQKYASELGFKTKKNVSDMSNPEKVMIRKFLSNIRPPDLFRLNQQIEEQLITKIHTIIRDSYQRYHMDKPSAVHENLLENRCGRPSFEVWNSARMFFKYEHLYGSGNCGTSFADQRDIFVLFFGKHDGALPSVDAAEPVTFSHSTIEFETNSSVINDSHLVQAQSATDYYADGSRASTASPVPLDLNFASSSIAGKRRREDDKPVEKEARLDTEEDNTTWYDSVLMNAKALKKIADDASISSHIIVCHTQTEKLKIDIRERTKIPDLFNENVGQIFAVETSSYSKKRIKVYELKTVTAIPVISGFLGSRLLLVNKSSEHQKLLEEYRKDNTRFWRYLLDLSKKEESYDEEEL